MTTTPNARSYLFAPANRLDRVDKALRTHADVVIADLEDAVAPAEKESARHGLVDWLAGVGASIVVRTNGADTEWFEEDLRACAHPRVRALVIPKSDDPLVLRQCVARAPDARILPLIESASGFAALERLALVPNVERFVFGTIDFQLDLGIDGEGDELLFFRSTLVLASRVAGLASPVDGVSTSVSDLDAVRHDALRARKLGFGAKLCIHPNQVDPVNASFSPSEDELTWARRVVEAAADSQGNAISVDGKMVDKPVIDRANRLLDQARSIG